MTRRPTPWLLLVLVGVLVPVLIVGCGQRGRVSTGYSEGIDPEGEDAYSTSSSIEFGSAIDMQFRDVESHLRSGRYRQAIQGAQVLYQDRGLDRERRARALLLWAEAEGHALNPGRDMDSAIARLELLETEFSDTEAADDAEDALERMRSFIHDGLRADPEPEEQ